MCVQVYFTTLRSAHPDQLFDAARRSITLPARLDTPHVLVTVRAILTELAVPQPEFGAVCWCGEAVELLPRVPQQRRSGQVVSHGA